MVTFSKVKDKVKANYGGVDFDYFPAKNTRLFVSNKTNTIRIVDVTDRKNTTSVIATDIVGNPGGTADAIADWLITNFFFDTSALEYFGEFGTYNDLIVGGPATAGSFAYVLNSQGTKWLPGTIGGTFYGAGWYYYTGSAWVNKNDEIFEGLDNLTLNNRILLKQGNIATILSSPLDSTKEYFIDGIIDLTGLGVSIEVPSGGLELKGYSFDTSKIICSDNNYTMFTSPVGGSGNVLGENFALTTSGTSSKVFDLVANTGFEAIELNRVNYNDCTSLGEINNYRQGLETGTGRFGGTPELELSGSWLGGYFIDTSIVRSLTNGAYSLYKAGSGFSMNSRFRSNQNIDLPANASLLDFSASNFPNPSTLQLEGAIISRNGSFDATDSNITPNISEGDLASSWSNNIGVKNTFEGGSISISTEAETIINSLGVFEDLNASSWTASHLQHFDNPSDGQLRHLGNTPREYKVITDFIVDGSPNREIVLRVVKYDSSTASNVTIFDQPRQVSNFVGGRDVAFFNININVELDQNDYIFLQLANNTDSSNLTAEEGSYFTIEQR